MDKQTQQVLKQFPEFLVTKTRRHYRVSNPLTGQFVITASTPSGCRHVDNFRADLKRLRRGCGYQTPFTNRRNQLSGDVSINSAARS